MKPIFYPTITTISKKHLEKLEEANRLGINKLSVFFSTLPASERTSYYKLLEESDISEIPFAHIRGDFSKDEIYYLKNQFKTKLFNIHSSNQHRIFFDLSELKKEIYIENTLTELTEDELNNYGGICLDISHLESDRLLAKSRYEYFQSLIKMIPVPCGHASAVKQQLSYTGSSERESFATHTFTDFTDFDYLVKYKDILPPVIALEVENPLAEQVRAIEYINKLLNI